MNKPHRHKTLYRIFKKKGKNFVPWFIFIFLVFSLTSASLAKITLIVFGDSVTRRNPKGSDNYVQKLAEKLGSDYDVSNFGVDGLTMVKKANHSCWDDKNFKKIFEIKPDILTIMLGTNDAKPGNWSRHGDSYEDDAHALVDTFLTISPKPRLMIALTPHAFKNRYGISDDAISNEQVPALKSVAEQTGVEIIDVHTPTNSADCFADGVHLSGKGTDIIAEVFFECITKSPSLSLKSKLFNQPHWDRPAIQIGLTKKAGLPTSSSVVILYSNKSGPEIPRKQIFLINGKKAFYRTGPISEIVR